MAIGRHQRNNRINQRGFIGTSRAIIEGILRRISGKIGPAGRHTQQMPAGGKPQQADLFFPRANQPQRPLGVLQRRQRAGAPPFAGQPVAQDRRYNRVRSASARQARLLSPFRCAGSASGGNQYTMTAG
jgi:hypothetical protein